MAAAAYLAVASSSSDARRKAARTFNSRRGPPRRARHERTGSEVRFEPPLAEPEWSADGIDRGEFFLAPNVGEEPRPARIVSGGELSRVMLRSRR